MIELLFAISLIVLGSFLEVYYYAYRFVNDGIELWLAITIGSALTLLLSLVVFQQKGKILSWHSILILTLAAYSVIATSAGQSFSLSVFEKKEVQENVNEQYRQKEIEDIEKRINAIDIEYKTISVKINATVETLQDRWKWKNTLAIAEEKQKELAEERKTLVNQLSELRKNAISYNDIKQKSTNIYQFYANFFKLNDEFLQIFLQTVLSIFIALMSPIGIISIMRRENKPVEKEEKQEKITSDMIEKRWRPLVEKWVSINWIGVKTGRSNEMLPRSTFFEFIKKRGDTFSEKDYNLILFCAKKKKILDTNVLKYYNESEVVKIILEELKNYGNKKNRTNKNKN